MELNELVIEMHGIMEQRGKLLEQCEQLEARLREIESDIQARLDISAEGFAKLTEEEFQMMMADLGDPMQLTIEVVYAREDIQFIKEVQVPRGATIEDGIAVCGILEEFPEIDLGNNKVGIYGAIKPPGEALHDGDRIEIYRPVENKG
jgi:putative ubiquitin-RnfH superfamily antitoxin RatB of RatAB toxin-antitoxin module